MTKPETREPPPHPNASYEIYCVEIAAGLTSQDAVAVSGWDAPMPLEVGEKVCPAGSPLAHQLLRRIEARMRTIDELERNVDGDERHEFLMRGRRARAELDWVRTLIVSGGVWPACDENGNPILPEKKSKKKPPSKRDTTGKWLPQEETAP